MIAIDYSGKRFWCKPNKTIYIHCKHISTFRENQLQLKENDPQVAIQQLNGQGIKGYFKIIIILIWWYSNNRKWRSLLLYKQNDQIELKKIYKQIQKMKNSKSNHQIKITIQFTNTTDQ